MKENTVVKHIPKGSVSIFSKTQREQMIDELIILLYKCTKRSEMEAKIIEYGYSKGTVKDIMAEVQQKAAKKFTPEEIEVSKRQIKELSEDIMADKDEFSMARIKAAELLGKITKSFNPDVAVQNNIVNNLNLSELTTEEIQRILNVNNDH